MSREADLARRSEEIFRFFREAVSNKAIVSQYLQDADTAMEEYKAEIDRLQTAIHVLQNKRNRLKATIDSYRSLLSPIHSMPSEILTMIFSCFCEENVLSRKKPPAVIRLSMVCGRWRGIVLSTPSLWSSISINFVPWAKEKKFRVLNRLTERFVELSKNHPLELTLFLPKASFETGSYARGRPTLDSLVRSCSRWESVTIWIYLPFFPFNVLAPILGQLSALRSLELTCSDDGSSVLWPNAVDSPVDLFKTCPALERLDLQVPLTNLPLPWSQITELDLSDSFANSALPILSLCPAVRVVSLSRLSSTTVHSGSNQQGPPNHIVSDRVESVHILAAFQSDIDDVLQHLTFRKVTTVGIHGNCSSLQDHWETWDGAHLQAFLLRSSCGLTTLELRDLPMTDTQALSLLRSLPALETLSIRECSGHTENIIITKTFLGDLACLTLPCADPILPRLSNLTLFLHAKGIDPEAFLQLLSSRWRLQDLHAAELDQETRRLQFVTITVLTDKENYDETSLNCLRCFEKAGMNLKITYGGESDFCPTSDGEDDDEFSSYLDQ